MIRSMVPGINVCRYIFREVTLFLSKKLLLNGTLLEGRGGSTFEVECDDTDIWAVGGRDGTLQGDWLPLSMMRECDKLLTSAAAPLYHDGYESDLAANYVK